MIRTQIQLICSKRFRQREGHGTQNEINFLATPIELRKDHFATTSSSSPSLAICISKLVQKFVSPSPRMPTCTWVLKFPPTNICLPARLAPSRIFFSTHTFSARGPMTPPYCALGSADCFHTGQSPDVLNPTSTIRMGVGGCCRGVGGGVSAWSWLTGGVLPSTLLWVDKLWTSFGPGGKVQKTAWPRG